MAHNTLLNGLFLFFNCNQPVQTLHGPENHARALKIGRLREAGGISPPYLFARAKSDQWMSGIPFKWLLDVLTESVIFSQFNHK